MSTPKKLPLAAEATRDEMTAEMQRIARKLRHLGFHDMADRFEWCCTAANGRIANLEATLRRCNDAATEAGNDKRHTLYQREVARGLGAIIRKEMAGLGMD